MAVGIGSWGSLGWWLEWFGRCDGNWVLYLKLARWPFFVCETGLKEAVFGSGIKYVKKIRRYMRGSVFEGARFL